MYAPLAGLRGLWLAWQRTPLRLLFHRFAAVLGQVNARESALSGETGESILRLSRSLQYRALSGEPLERILPEAYALVREAARRALGMRPYDVQVLGGVAMHRGYVAEMQTGEGKTLAAAFPLYLAALAGRGAHLATANDYLADRDADLLRPVYESLGLTVARIQTGMSRGQRRQAYACDITYAAARELGFDFLRDRLLDDARGGRPRDWLGAMLGGASDSSHSARVQRDLHFVLVDEADSILIDEARTPLILSSLPGPSAEAAEATFRWAAAVAAQFEDDIDFGHDSARRTWNLTPAGRRKVRTLDKPAALSSVPLLDLYESVERAIRVAREFFRDRQYVIRDGQVVIVDESTGRLAEGRRWREGVHQAVEAKEGLTLSVKTGEAARVTVQDFFLLYRHRAAMTGTATSSHRELRRIYRLSACVVPTNRPECRTRLPDLVFGNAASKWEAVVEEIARLHATGRPVLVGTRSIESSERLSLRLTDRGIVHTVLNAHRHAEEATIVAQAGQIGRVTVATNMAGRGTDIQLDPEVAARGGLHVICTELHESARIDRQLIGRCGRQGDPGSYRQFMALDDEIVSLGLGPRCAERLRRLGASAGGNLPPRFAVLLRRAQGKVERHDFRQRRLLLYQECERKKMQLEMGQDPYLDSSE